MRHHRGDAPLLGVKQVTGQGLQDQADEPQQFQRVLPQLVDGAANAAKHLNAGVLLGGLGRHAEVAHRGIDRLQQGTVGSRESGGGVGQLADTFGAQQLDQQRSACRVEAGHVIEVNVGAVVVLAGQLRVELLEACVIGQRPVATDVEPGRFTRSV